MTKVDVSGCEPAGWEGAGEGGRVRRLEEQRREWSILYPDRCEADWVEPYFVRGQVKDARLPAPGIEAPWGDRFK